MIIIVVFIININRDADMTLSKKDLFIFYKFLGPTDESGSCTK